MRASPLEPDRAWPTVPAASSTTTCHPRRASARAAHRPRSPAPTTTQRRRSGTATIIGTPHRTGPRSPGCEWDPAVRSAAVTSGIDVSLHPTYGTSHPPGDIDLLAEPAEPADSVASADEPSAAPATPRSRIGRAARAVGFHLGAIALFSLPAVALWWHVWSGHPSSTLTCGCGDPAQEVWFMAWPAWAIAHLHNLFFSGAVNVPHGANLLSNTSGTLVGVVLAPVTWLFGPVTATNVALTLAPALARGAASPPSARSSPGSPVPSRPGLVYGYSAAIVTSLAFGHVSVTWLVIPPLLFTTLHEIVIRQEHSVRRDGLVLAALLVVQFLISPEVLVMCLLLATVGLLAVMAVGWRQVRARAGHALPALGLAAGVTVALLAYPAWFGVAGPQAVTGVLFPLAPILGVPLSGLLSPGQYGAFANEYVRFGGYLGRNGPAGRLRRRRAWRWPRWRRSWRPGAGPSHGCSSS